MFNVLDYGADPTGATASDAAFLTAIQGAVGTSDPSVTVRQAKGPVYAPAGIYKLTTDVNAASVYGFNFYGDGPGQTILRASGSDFTDGILNIDGSLDARVGGFNLEGDATAQVPNALNLTWTTAAALASSGNKLYDIRVRSLKFVNGISLAGCGPRQLDGTVLDNITVNGGRQPGQWSSTGNWQTGFTFGNGSWGNNYNHTGRGLSPSGCNIGYKINASSLELDGAEPACNGTDFWILPGAQCSVENVQSQQSGQLIAGQPSFNPAPVGIRDCEFVTTEATTPNCISIHGGLWHLDNLYVQIYNPDPAIADYITPVVLCSGDGGGRPSRVTIDNLTAYGAMTSAVRPMAGQTRVAVRNYGNYYPKTGLYAAGAPGDMEAFYTGSTWNMVA